MKHINGLASLAAAGCVAASMGTAANAWVVNDSLATDSSVNYHSFAVETAGDFSFNIVARDVLSDLDSYIYLFLGLQPVVANVIIENDDSYDFGWDFDGSVDNYDSYIPSVALTPGYYTLAVGSYDLSPEAAESGFNYYGFSSGAYRMTAGGTGTIAPVPLPATLPFILAGLGMLGFAGSRKRNKTNA